MEVKKWSCVTKEHVAEACRQYDNGMDFPARDAENTFLRFNGRVYPAKFIRGLAYRVATGERLDPNVDFSGGKETKDFFERLGFTVEYKGKK